MKRTAANIVREYAPFPDVTQVNGVSYDGTHVWIATGETLNAVDPDSGKTVRAIKVPAHAGTAFDGQYLFQIAGDLTQLQVAASADSATIEKIHPGQMAAIESKINFTVPSQKALFLCCSYDEFRWLMLSP